ncbi:MAG TPA: hypothetical protein VIO62_02185, partial [Candidatus Dormibacteraeota bacterium]
VSSLSAELDGLIVPRRGPAGTDASQVADVIEVALIFPVRRCCLGVVGHPVNQIDFTPYSPNSGPGTGGGLRFETRQPNSVLAGPGRNWQSARRSA